MTDQTPTAAGRAALALLRQQVEQLQHECRQLREALGQGETNLLEIIEDRDRFERERDEAIKEANRRDAKWMSGIDAECGQKFDYKGDPSDSATWTLGRFVSQLRAERDDAVAKYATALRAATNVMNSDNPLRNLTPADVEALREGHVTAGVVVEALRRSIPDGPQWGCADREHQADEINAMLAAAEDAK